MKRYHVISISVLLGLVTGLSVSKAADAAQFDCEGVTVTHKAAEITRTDSGAYIESMPERLIVGGAMVTGLHYGGELRFDGSDSIQLIGKAGGGLVNFMYQPVTKKAQLLFAKAGMVYDCTRKA